MKKIKMKGWMIGGLVGMITGILYNFNKTFFVLGTFGNLKFPLFLWLIFGLMVGYISSVRIKKSLKFSLSLGLFSLVVIFNSLTLKTYHNILRTIIEKIILFPFWGLLHSYSYLGWLIGIGLIFIEWSLIAVLCYSLVNKFKK